MLLGLCVSSLCRGFICKALASHPKPRNPAPRFPAALCEDRKQIEKEPLLYPSLRPQVFAFDKQKLQKILQGSGPIRGFIGVSKGATP